MLYETYDNPKLLPFKDETEEKRIDVLFNESCTIAMRSMRNRGLSYSDGERYEAIGNEIVELHDALIKRYVASFASAEQGIMDDLSELLNAITADEVNAWIAENIADYHSLTDEEEKSIRMLLDYNYTSAHLYMQTAVKAQLLAVDFCGGDTAAAEELVAAAAARLYAPRKGEEGTQMCYPHRETRDKQPVVEISEIPSATNYLVSRSKLSNEFTKIAPYHPLNVGGNAIIEVHLTPPAQATLSEFDRHMQDAIGDMVRRAGENIIVTPAQIYKAFSGADADADISDEKQQEVIQSVDKLMHTEIVIDWRDQYAKHKHLPCRDKGNIKTTLKGYAIAGEKLEHTTYHHKGKQLKTEVAYRIFTMPPAVRYSADIGQVSHFSKKYLTAAVKPTTPSKEKQGAKIRGSTQKDILKRVLAIEIERMKHEQESFGSYNGKLTYETIAQKAGIELTAKKIEYLRKSIDDILTAFVKEKTLMVKSFEKEKTGRAYTGVAIILRSKVSKPVKRRP